MTTQLQLINIVIILLFTPAPSRVQHRVANFLNILSEDLYLLFSQRLCLSYALLLLFALCIVCRLLLLRFDSTSSSAGRYGMMRQGNVRKSVLKSFRKFLTPCTLVGQYQHFCEHTL